MAWDKGKYYTRSRKVNGRVVREYYGNSEAARIIACLDESEQDGRALERHCRRKEREEILALDRDLKTLCEAADLLARAALLASGYHQHHRGEWRKKRERT